jgi:hypothetical protein
MPVDAQRFGPGVFEYSGMCCSCGMRYRLIVQRLIHHFSPQISTVMDKFETQFSDLDVQTSYMEQTMSSSTATTTPQDQVDALINRVADEAGLERQHELGTRAKVPETVQQEETEKPVGEEDARLAERLRALRVSARRGRVYVSDHFTACDVITRTMVVLGYSWFMRHLCVMYIGLYASSMCLTPYVLIPYASCFSALASSLSRVTFSSSTASALANLLRFRISGP